MRTSQLALRRASVISPQCGVIGLHDVLVGGDGTIVAIEPHTTADRWRTVESIDVGGRPLIPGLTDSHFHLLSTGLQLVSADLSGSTTTEDALEHLSAAGQDFDAEWLMAGQLNEEFFADPHLPTLADLDRLFPTRPVFVEHRSLHFALCNSVALSRLGLSDLCGDGHLHGKQLARARQRVLEFQGGDFVARAFRAASQQAAERGATTLHVMEGGQMFGDFSVEILQDVRDTLATDTVLYWCGTDVAYATERGFDRVGGDVAIDGTFGSRTAALGEPYADDSGTCGTIHLAPQEVSTFFAAATRAGLQPGLHAIGTRAIEIGLDAIEHAKNADGDGPRYRLEHCGEITERQIERAAALGVAVSTQPVFTYLRGQPGGVYEQRLGPQRNQAVYPLRRLLDAGIRVAGGSDSPVAPNDSLLGLESCVNATYETQRVGLLEALRVFTSDAAWCAGEENVKGDIKAGMRADLVILKDDLVGRAPNRIHDIGISLVMRGGEIVYNAERTMIGGSPVAVNFQVPTNKAIRMARIVNPSDGRSLVGTVAHGLLRGPLEGEEPADQLGVAAREAGAAGLDAIMIGPGALGRFARDLAGRSAPGLIVCLEWTSEFREGPRTSRAEPRSSIIGTVEDALSLSADGIMSYVFLGWDDPVAEAAHVAANAALSRECERLGVVRMIEIMVRGRDFVDDHFRADYIANAARIAAEIGCDLVKVEWPGSAAGMAEVVRACPVPVLVAGGGLLPHPEVVAMAEEALRGGAAGFVVGRNIVQATSRSELIRDLAAAVHPGVETVATQTR